MKTSKRLGSIWLILITVMAIFVFANTASAQNKTSYMRIAKIVADSVRLESFKTALKEGMETAFQIEPGILSLYAVYEKTILLM